MAAIASATAGCRQRGMHIPCGGGAGRCLCPRPPDGEIGARMRPVLREGCMTKTTNDRDPSGAAAEAAPESVSRRGFLSGGAAGVGAVALAGAAAAETNGQIKWDYSADVVVI